MMDDDDISYKIPEMIERFERRAAIVSAYLAAAFALVLLGHAL